MKADDGGRGGEQRGGTTPPGVTPPPNHSLNVHKQVPERISRWYMTNVIPKPTVRASV